MKRAADLAPGDMIKCLHPPGSARVVKAYESPRKMQIGPKGNPPTGKGDAIAWIIEFELIDGMSKGVRDHSFQHPDDRIVTP